MPSNPSQIGANKWIDRKHGLTKPTDMTEGGGTTLHIIGDMMMGMMVFGGAYSWKRQTGQHLKPTNLGWTNWFTHQTWLNWYGCPVIWSWVSYLAIKTGTSCYKSVVQSTTQRHPKKKNNTLKVTHPPVSLLFSRTTRNRAWNPLPRPTSMICADPVGTAGRQAKLQEQRRSVQPRCLPEGQDMFLMLKRSEGMDGFMIHFITVNDIIPATPTHSFPACFTHQ